MSDIPDQLDDVTDVINQDRSWGHPQETNIMDFVRMSNFHDEVSRRIVSELHDIVIVSEEARILSQYISLPKPSTQRVLDRLPKE